MITPTTSAQCPETGQDNKRTPVLAFMQGTLLMTLRFLETLVDRTCWHCRDVVGTTKDLGGESEKASHFL